MTQGRRIDATKRARILKLLRSEDPPSATVIAQRFNVDRRTVDALVLQLRAARAPLEERKGLIELGWFGSLDDDPH
jgi:DNA-binding MarR family transcriptional regulator